MKLEELQIKNHPILKNLYLNFRNEQTNLPYQIIVFVGENGCGKTSLLNELFDYTKSKYIINKKQKYDIMPNLGFHSLFLRQNSLYTISQNEIVNAINGEVGPYPIDSNSDLIGGKSVYGMRRSSKINTKSLGKDVVSLFNDKVILDAYIENKISGIKCSGKVMELINGAQGDIDLSRLSSGQQEILIKMKILQNIVVATDFILFDEPEISLHPRWQKCIIKFLKEIVDNQEGDYPQMFIATHSENILESLLDFEDVLIIRFSKINDSITIEPINQDLLTLPHITFAELNYIVFNIPTFDYHNHLYSYYCELAGSDSVAFIDKSIRESQYFEDKYKKTWCGEKKIWNKKSNKFDTVSSVTYTLPSYVRNYFHHPKKGKKPTAEELNSSILFMRQLIKELESKKADL